jgi:hypothetical protein
MEDDESKKERREKLAAKQRAFHEQERRRRGSVSKEGKKMKTSTFIQSTSKEGLDKFIEHALQEKRIDKVEVLDLSRHKISELSPRVRFYMRMLRHLRVLNLHGNKLRLVPSEIGTLTYSYLKSQTNSQPALITNSKTILPISIVLPLSR